MKKIVIVTTTLLTVCLSLLVFNIFKTQEITRITDIESTLYSFKIYPKQSNKNSDEVIAFYQKLSEDYKISIVKTDSYEDRVIKSAILADTFPNQQLGLSELDFTKNPDGIYSSYDRPHQVGQIKTFLNAKPILFQSLSHYFKDASRSINGVYTIISTEPFDKEEVLKELSDFFDMSTEALTQFEGQSFIGYVNQKLILISLIIGTSFIILILSIIYLPLSQMKMIGVKKLLGFTNQAIFLEFIKPNIIAICLTAIIIDSFSYLFLDHIPQYFFMALIWGQLFFLFIYLFLFLGLYLIVQAITVSKLLKGFSRFTLGVWLHYLLKIAMSGLLLGLFLMMSKTLVDLNAKITYQNQWQEEGEGLVTLETYKPSSQLNQALLSDQAEANHYFTELYQKLNDKTKARYIRSETLDPQARFGNTDFTKPLDIMSVNQNYLNSLKLSQLPEIKQTNDKLFILPTSYKKQEKQIKALLQQFTHTLLSHEEQHDTDPKTIAIQLIYYPDDIAVFPYSDKRKTNYQNPIFALVNEQLLFEEAAYLTNTGLTNPLKIPHTAENIKLANQISSEIDTETHLIFSSLFDIQESYISSLKDGLTNFKHLLFIVMGLNVVLSYSLAAIFFICMNPYLRVTKFLGWRFIDRYKTLLIFTSSCYFLVFLITLFLSKQHLLSLGLVLYFICDISLMSYFLYRQEKKSLHITLKGGYN